MGCTIYVWIVYSYLQDCIATCMYGLHSYTYRRSQKTGYQYIYVSLLGLINSYILVATYIDSYILIATHIDSYILISAYIDSCILSVLYVLYSLDGPRKLISQDVFID